MTASAIIAAARIKLLETTASFWTDDELLGHLNAAVRDLWRAISDNHQDYFFTISTAPTMDASTATLTAVPSNVAKVIGIEPQDLNRYGSLNFFPKRYTHPDFIAKRSLEAQDPGSAGPILYAVAGAGGPVGAPTIYVAPMISAQVALRLIYTPTVPALTIVGTDSPNPVPGESDDALIAYVIAHGLAKESDDRQPDPGWLAKYGTEKTNILTFLAPRQEDEPDVAEGVHDIYMQ